MFNYYFLSDKKGDSKALIHSISMNCVYKLNTKKYIYINQTLSK